MPPGNLNAANLFKLATYETLLLLLNAATYYNGVVLAKRPVYAYQ